MRVAAVMAGTDEEIWVFCSWFGTLSSAEKSWFLERLVPLATPHKLFARLELAALLGDGDRTLSTTPPAASWDDCRDFQQRALFCAARVRTWSVARANSLVNALEEIDQDAVYEFYRRIARSNAEEP